MINAINHSNIINRIIDFQKNPPPDLNIPCFIIPTRVNSNMRDDYENDLSYLPKRWNLSREEFIDMLYRGQSRKKNTITYLSEIGLVSTDSFGNIINGTLISRSYLTINFSPRFHCPEISIPNGPRCINTDDVSPLSLSTEFDSNFKFDASGCKSRDDLSLVSLSSQFASKCSLDALRSDDVSPASLSSESGDKCSFDASKCTDDVLPVSLSSELSNKYPHEEDCSSTDSFTRNSFSDSTLYREVNSIVSRRQYRDYELKTLLDFLGRKVYQKDWVDYETLKAENEQLKLEVEQMKKPYLIAEQQKDAVHLIQQYKTETELTRFFLDGILTASVPDRRSTALKTSDIINYFGISNKKRIYKAYRNRKALKSGDSSSFTRFSARKKRDDNVDELMFSHLHAFVHDDDDTRVDSNGKLVRCCTSHGTKDEEKKHPIRNWRHEGDLETQYDIFKKSVHYRKYISQLRAIDYWKLKPEKDPLTFAKFESFTKKIPCLRDPTDASCVDEVKVAAHESFQSLLKFTITLNKLAFAPTTPETTENATSKNAEDEESITSENEFEIDFEEMKRQVQQEIESTDALPDFCSEEEASSSGQSCRSESPSSRNSEDLDDESTTSESECETEYKDTRLGNEDETENVESVQYDESKDEKAPSPCKTCMDANKICLYYLFSNKSLTVRDLEREIICPKVSCPDLMLDSDKECPKMYQYKCCMFQCNDCGLDKINWKCEYYANNTALTKVKVWEKNKENGQNELHDKVVQVNEVVELLKKAMTDYIPHHFELNWFFRYQKQEIERISQELMNGITPDYDPVLVFTDFSAQWSLVPGEKGTSHINQHLSVNVHVVLHNFRIVEMQETNGNTSKKPIFDTSVAYFVGGANGKGKQNDHIFHNAALKAMLDKLLGSAINDKKVYVKIFTDGSPNQYACRQNLGMLHDHKDKLALELISHIIACKGGFKGAWDAFGKRIKDLYKKAMKVAKLNMHENALQVFEFLYDILKKTKKSSPDLMKKGTWTITSESFYLVTDNIDEYNHVKETHRGDSVVFTNRDVVQAERDKLEPIPELKQYHCFSTDSYTHQVELLSFEPLERFDQS